MGAQGHPAPDPNHPLLSIIYQWLHLPHISTAGHDQVQIVSPSEPAVDTRQREQASMITIHDTKQQNTTTTTIVLRINQPQMLPTLTKTRIEEACLPYICRAFDQDKTTLDPTIRQEHVDHLYMKGDVLFCLVQVIQRQEGGRGALVEETSDERSQPSCVVLGHLLWSAMFPVNTLPSPPPITPMQAAYMIGIVCDPHIQGRGMARLLYLRAIHSLQPSLVVTRTANPAILRLLRHTPAMAPTITIQPKQTAHRSSSSSDSQRKMVETNKTVTQENDHQETQAWLYPFDCGTDDHRQRARHLANQIMTTSHCRDHFSDSDLAKYDTNNLVFRNVYSEDNQKVFSRGGGGGASEGGSPPKAGNNVLLKPGDAALCIYCRVVE